MRQVLTYLSLAIVLLLSVTSSIPATAQDSEDNNEPILINMEDGEGSFSIQQDVETKATVELLVGDQLYQLIVPVTVQIDTTKLLADALISAPASRQIGTFLFEPVHLEVIEDEYEQGFRTLEPSSADNVLVLYMANITNLDKVEANLAYTSLLETTAIDDAGNRYEEEMRFCDEIAPGEKVPCLFIFDVPATANLIDLDVAAKSYKQFSFTTIDETKKE